VRAEAEALAAQSGGKFALEFIEPEAGNGGAAAQRIVEEWGFQPMIAALDDDREFYFYLTLEDDQQVIQLPTGRFTPEDFGDSLEAGLRRFASGFTRSVALALPDGHGTDARHAAAGPQLRTLQQSVSRDHTHDHGGPGRRQRGCGC
jgi:ABC-2 type transport system permease protein